MSKFGILLHVCQFISVMFCILRFSIVNIVG